LSDILRINYFVVRNDYYYNLDWAKTESPAVYTKAIQKNKIFSYKKNFGQWDIYILKRDYDVLHAYPYTAISAYNGEGHFTDAINFLRPNISSSSAEKTVLANIDDVNAFSNSLVPLVKNNVYFY